MAIQISLTTSGTVFTSKRFLRILAVPVGMLFKEMVDHMLAVNAAVKIMLYTATTVHDGTCLWRRMTYLRN